MGSPGFIQSQPNFDNLQIVLIGYTSVSSDGSTQNWTTVQHNFGYRPIIFAFLNGVSLSSIFTSGIVPLPTYSSATIDTTAHTVNFRTYLQCATDTTSSYFILFNSTGSAISSLPIKYYLMRERSS